MVRVTNTYAAPLALPGPSVALGGVELPPGVTDVDDAVWTSAMAAPMVQKWVALGLLVVEAPKKSIKG